MVRKFGPFDTSQFYEVENRRMQRAFNPATGFVKPGQGAVTAGTGAQLVIAAYPDGALIDGLYVENTATETVTLTTNSGNTNPRIDRLVMRLDMTAKTIAPFQIVGTPAASPTAPPLVNTGTVVDMPLYRYTMPGSASAQNPGSLVDERVWLDGGERIVATMAQRPTTGLTPGSRVRPLDRPSVLYVYDGTRFAQEGLPASSVAGAPAGCYVTEQSDTATVAINSSGNGSFTLPLPFAFSAPPVYADLTIGDGDGVDPPVTVTPYNGLHTTGALVGFVRMESGGRAPAGRTVRVNYRTRGYNT